jgi:hypothetical protein
MNGLHHTNPNRSGGKHMAPKQEPEGPQLTTVVILGLLTFLLGGFLGTLSLMTRPVATYRNPPDPESLKSGEVYLLRGNRNSSDDWRGKEASWKNGEVNRLVISEGELNEWSRDRMDPGNPEDAPESEASWMDRLEVTATPIDFRILESGLQMATELELPGLFPRTTFIYQVKGRLVAGPEGLRFQPETGTLGRAPLGSVPVTRGLLYHFVRAQFDETGYPESLRELLGEVGSVEIVEDKLILERAAAG